MVVFVVAAYSAKRLFTVTSFYEYGHYRGDSVADIAAEKPRYKGSAYCEGCHAEQYAAWSKSVHNQPEIGKGVRCETCHGPAGGRDEYLYTPATTGPDHPKNLKLVVPNDSRQLCPICHEKMPGRPSQQPQIVVSEHAGTQQCVECHNPHSPKIEVAAAKPAHPGDAAAGKEKAEACAGCHGPAGISDNLPGPTLAGQSETYLASALGEYRAGSRTNPMMTAMVAAASDDDVANLAAYFHGLKCDSALDAAKQASLPSRTAAARCVTCHGPSGTAPSASFPNLAGQSKDYLLAALHAYKSGERKNATMAGVVKNLSDADAETVASYYANASCR